MYIKRVLLAALTATALGVTAAPAACAITDGETSYINDMTSVGMGPPVSLVAARNGDLAGLERMLAEDVSSVADGGGLPGVARRPMRGMEVARYLAATVSRSVAGVAAFIQEVNGVPAVVSWSGTTLVGVLIPEIAGERITAVRIVANPDKLGFLADQAVRLSRSPEVSGS